MNNLGRFVKWSAVLIAFLWMGAAGWHQFFATTDADRTAYQQQLYEQRLRDCRSQYATRYDCTSEVIRRQNHEIVVLWAIRLGIIFGPPLALALVYSIVSNTRERRKEVRRNRARLERKAREAEEARQRAIEHGRQQIEEARKRAEQNDQGGDATGNAEVDSASDSGFHKTTSELT
jgi:hypothetical protein